MRTELSCTVMVDVPEGFLPLRIGKRLITLAFLFPESHFMETKYIQFMADLKRIIIQSRYIAARAVNKEQLPG